MECRSIAKKALSYAALVLSLAIFFGFWFFLSVCMVWMILAVLFVFFAISLCIGLRNLSRHATEENGRSKFLIVCFASGCGMIVSVAAPALYLLY